MAAILYKLWPATELELSPLFGHHITLAAKCHNVPQTSVKIQYAYKRLLFLSGCHKCYGFEMDQSFSSFNFESDKNTCNLNWLETLQIKIENVLPVTSFHSSFILPPQKLRSLEARSCISLQEEWGWTNEIIFESLRRHTLFCRNFWNMFRSSLVLDSNEHTMQ